MYLSSKGSLAERIDLILLYINNRIPHIGQFVSMGVREVLSMLFVDRKERIQSAVAQNNGSWSWREKTECEDEAEYIKNALSPAKDVIVSIIDNTKNRDK